MNHEMTVEEREQARIEQTMRRIAEKHTGASIRPSWKPQQQQQKPKEQPKVTVSSATTAGQKPEPEWVFLLFSFFSILSFILRNDVSENLLVPNDLRL
jgi:hypothetical protein